MGGAPMHVHAHTHTCVVNMIISCKWPSPLDLGKSWGFPLMSYVHACACVCMCVEAPSHHPHLPSPPSRKGTPTISQNSIALELIKIFQFCLKI